MEGPKGDDVVKVASNVTKKLPPLRPIPGLVPVKNFAPFDKQKDQDVVKSCNENESEQSGRKIVSDDNIVSSASSSNILSGIKLQIKKNANVTESKPDEDEIEEVDDEDDEEEDPKAPPYSDIGESSGGDNDNSFDDEEELEPKSKKLKMDKDNEEDSNLEMDEESNTNNKSNSKSIEEVSSKMSDIVNKVNIKQKIVKPNELNLKAKLEKNQKSIAIKPKKKQNAKDNKASIAKSSNIDETGESRDQSDSHGSKADNEKDEDGNEDSNDGTRRTKRKRKPTKPFEIIPRLKLKKKKGKDSKRADEDDTVANIKKEKSDFVSSSSEFIGVRPKSGRGSRGGKIPGASGRGRGRPKGTGTPLRVVRVKAEKKEKKEQKEQKVKKVKKGGKQNDSTSSIETFASPSTPDQVVKEEICDESETPSGTSAENSPIRGGLKPRGRGSRGPRLSRGSTGSTRGSRGGVVRKLTLKEKKKKIIAKKEKLIAKKEKIIKLPQKKPPLQVFEEETRMSADIKPMNGDIQILLQDEESQSNSNSTNTNTPAKTKKFSKDNLEDRKPVTAENLYEYSWPPNDRNARLYILQEQITEYLDVKSFKRKYPDLERRVVEMHERDFLRQNKIVSETQATQGLTALRSSDVLDIMSNDFPEKYEEFIKTLEQRLEKERQKSIPQVAPPPRDRTAEFMRRIMKSCSKWNSQLNVERKEDRSCSFDLQTYTLHYPQGKMKVLPKESTQISTYPVALLPGQFCDNYREYTSTELKYLPLNSVIYGPPLGSYEEMRPKSVCDDSDDSSDSDSDSSSDSSSSSSDGSSSSSRDISKDEMDVDNEGNKNGIDGIEEPKRYQRCKRCDGDQTQNKIGIPEVLINCGKCDVSNHPTCLELSLDMLPFIKKYNWQCTDCKNCNICEDPADEDKMLFCDLCDRGYHIYCVGLRKVPTGKWHCRICDSSFYCDSCGSKQPGGQSDDQWHHEYKKTDKGLKFFSHSHCSTCHKLFRKGVYCPGCLKVHINLEETKNNMRKCRTCEKWVHKECIKKTHQVGAFGFMCENCTKSNIMSINQKYTP